MPANGLTYAPPHNCACYPEAKLFGFNALASASPSRALGKVIETNRLERGPAFGQATDAAGNGESDWPTYRHDNLRSGFSSNRAVGAKSSLKNGSTKLEGKLSAVTLPRIQTLRRPRGRARSGGVARGNRQGALAVHHGRSRGFAAEYSRWPRVFWQR